MGTLKLLLGLIVSMMVVGQSAHALSVQVSRRDAKFPTQQMIEKQTFTDPLASNDSTIVSYAAGPTSAAVATLSTFTAQPDQPRVLTITPKGTTGDVEACVVTATGTNFFGATITDTFTFLADATGKQTGTKAFKTISSLSWAASCESGGFAATWHVGTSPAFGLKRCVAAAGDFFHSNLNGSKEATAPSLSVDSDEVEKNLVTFNGALNGANDFDLYFMQNYGCFP